MTRVYLDMDNVLADFDRELNNRGLFIDRENDRLTKQKVDKSVWTEEEKTRDSRVQEFMSEPGFFRNLSLMDGADKLWVAAGKPVVLTARPKNPEAAHRVTKEKREWIEEYFGEIPEDRFICCLRSQKADYANYYIPEGRYTNASFGGPNILVDDLEWNCSEWEKAGGIAILFRNMNQAINDLKKILSAVS